MHAADLACCRVAGSAVTVLCGPGDNLMIHAAIAVVQPGDVLVVATTSESSDGMFGELLAESCLAHKVAGLVIDAGVRDTWRSAPSDSRSGPRAISAQGTSKTIAGSVNIPIVCAGAAINPGDVIVGDADGVVVVPRESAPVVAARRPAPRQGTAHARSPERPASSDWISTDFATCSPSGASSGATDRTSSIL